MILLKDILYKVSLQATSGDMNIPIEKVHFDSRKVEKGDLFVAVKGTQVDGHKFIESAIEKLTKDDLSEFRAWFEEFDAKVWDMQFEEDASSGRLDKVAEQALGDYKNGRCKKI